MCPSTKADGEGTCTEGKGGPVPGDQKQVEVHSFWTGKVLPEWVQKCFKSYLVTGHEMSLWLYLKEERQAEMAALQALQQAYPGLRLRDANEIVPYTTAKKMFFHGMGKEGKWSGWAPFSDYFRYEVIARYGGWWVDADGVSVRHLRPLTEEGGSGSLVICTERHRLDFCDRRRIGAVAVADPYAAERKAADGAEGQADVALAKEPSGIAVAAPLDGGMGNFRSWADQVKAAGLNVSLVTNSHFRVSGSFLTAMRSLADEMRRLLETYAKEVEARGIASVQELDSSGKTRSAVPNGNIGMLLFQRMVRRLLEATGAGLPRPRVLHWSVFNPVEATEAPRMHRVLDGEEVLPGRHTHSVHIFRQVRDEWYKKGLKAPKMEPCVNDDVPPSVEAVRTAAGKPPPEPVIVRELPAPTGPLLKRRRTGGGTGAVRDRASSFPVEDLAGG